MQYSEDAVLWGDALLCDANCWGGGVSWGPGRGGGSTPEEVVPGEGAALGVDHVSLPLPLTQHLCRRS